jgi:hypothetical protein
MISTSTESLPYRYTLHTLPVPFLTAFEKPSIDEVSGYLARTAELGLAILRVQSSHSSLVCTTAIHWSSEYPPIEYWRNRCNASAGDLGKCAAGTASK